MHLSGVCPQRVRVLTASMTGFNTLSISRGHFIRRNYKRLTHKGEVWHQAITWTNVDYSSVGTHAIHLIVI